MSLAHFATLAIALTAISGLSGAAHAASDSTTAGARIVNSLSVIKTADLEIGKIVPAQQGGVIKIGATGTVECDATLTCLDESISPATFSVQGQAGYAYAVTLPNEIVMSNGNTQLRVTSVTSSVGTSGLLDASGLGELSVGGSVQVGEQQETGSYSGQFHITLEYN